jgi:thymidylate synthase (FAD)
MSTLRDTEIKVFDHGYLKLVDWMGADESIIEAARMSTGKGFSSWLPYYRCKLCEEVDTNFETHSQTGGICTHANNANGTLDHRWERFPKGDAGLLQFLYENRHDTPFEMVELVVEVQAPIMVFREWHRHRTQSYAEMSARYVQMPNLHYIPSIGRIVAASRAHRNKQQGGGGELKLSPRIRDLETGIAASIGRPADFSEAQIAAHVRHILHQEQQSIYALYEELLAMGIAPEVARIDTPVARYSRMRAKTDLRNWLAFLTLRSDNAAQWEIRQYAYALGYFIARLFPRTWDLWLSTDRKKPEIDKNGFIVGEVASSGP